ncbi:MAG TPA: tRNA (cytidine(34)-2'-O)-methyltransferase [Planctomicrobium sp.]|nr:tRNA (cytidine(34)-2'-O)-methyltransferase [Planctomicrobium sp.]
MSRNSETEVLSSSFTPLLNVVLYAPDIPQNTGNIGRSCVAVGAKLWLIRPLGFVMDSRYLKRAGMDYWEHVDCEVVDNWEQLLTRLSESGSPVGQFWFLTKFAEKLVWEANFQPGDVLVFGSESRGLPESLRLAHQETCLKLPMYDQVRSLNLASTANTVMYEAVRQIGGLPLK